MALRVTLPPVSLMVPIAVPVTTLVPTSSVLEMSEVRVGTFRMPAAVPDARTTPVAELSPTEVRPLTDRASPLASVSVPLPT